jgi:riboflavin kinase/FMN adenylyltransferase
MTPRKSGHITPNKDNTPPAVLSVGNFDGVHRGHARLIGRAAAAGRKIGARCVAVTFGKPFGARTGSVLTSAEEKASLLIKAGADEVITLDGGNKLWRLSPRDFARKILLRLNPAAIVAGYDFRFGRNAAGRARDLPAMLRESGRKIKLIVEKPLKYRGSIISSSAARMAVERGDVKAASRLLGRPYSVSGNVISGAGLGARIGFPTINISVPPEKMLPVGIFACFVSPETDNRRTTMLKAAAYAGKSPTLLRLKKNRLEVHIISRKGFSVAVKAARAWRVFFMDKIRGDKKFANVRVLKKQIKKDIIQAGALLKKAASKAISKRENPGMAIV